MKSKVINYEVINYEKVQTRIINHLIATTFSNKLIKYRDLVAVNL